MYDALIEGLQILKKYDISKCPFDIEDGIVVFFNVEYDKMTFEDQDRLEELGFEWDKPFYIYNVD